ncbi:hypothetical protein [Nocardia abscessus]|uniref:hypothetical protein n=1 Tax=Nocardia abscessus TaxID=120957 RepID=UPI002457408C|nr:hypothetical protein [Nocardia abscessus]
MVQAGEQSPRRLAEAAARREQALALWLNRRTFQQIADELGYADRSNARKAIMTALEETAARTIGLAEQARPIIAARLERLYEKWADRADDDPKAAALVLQMFDRFCKIYGLDRIQVDHTVTTRTQLDAEIEELVHKLSTAAPADPAITKES